MMMKEIRNSWQLYKRAEKNRVKLFFVQLSCISGKWPFGRKLRPVLGGPGQPLSTPQWSEFCSVTRHRDVIRSPDWECVVIGQIRECKGNFPVGAHRRFATAVWTEEWVFRGQRLQKGGRWEYYLQLCGLWEVALSAIKMLQIFIHDSFSRVGKKLPWPGKAQVRVGVGVECIFEVRKVFLVRNEETFHYYLIKKTNAVWSWWEIVVLQK